MAKVSAIANNTVLTNFALIKQEDILLRQSCSRVNIVRQNSKMCESASFSKIPPRILALLQEVGQVGDEVSQSVYVVGGFVRDLLLCRDNLDLDIVVEGDAICFARYLAEKWAGKLQTHREFGTGTVTRTDGLKLDFVSARCETYERPGTLPLVRYGTIEDDLCRRDFSINALAMTLNPDAFGELVDYTNGLRDLRAGYIRVIHNRSFIDDPTRIFRAIRYERRYGFQIVEGDQKRIREAINQGVLDLISGQRIRNEIDRILLEEAASGMIRRMLEFDLFRTIHPDWELPRAFDPLWNAAHQAIDWTKRYLPNDSIDVEAMLWMTLLTDSSPGLSPMPIGKSVPSPEHQAKRYNGLSSSETIESVSNRLILENQLRTKLIAKERLENALNTLSEDSKPSEVYKLFEPYPLEVLVFALMQPSQFRWCAAKIKSYLLDLRGVQPFINGNDLIQLGLRPNAEFAKLLWKTFAAQLDGQILTKQDAYQILGYKRDV